MKGLGRDNVVMMWMMFAVMVVHVVRVLFNQSEVPPMWISPIAIGAVKKTMTRKRLQAHVGPGSFLGEKI